MDKFTPFSLNIGGELRQYERPQVMGILNITPDSFYAGSRTFDEDSIRRRVSLLVSEGADMIDIGAYSSRPSAGDVPVEEELRRLRRGMGILREIAPEIIVSVDTFRAAVAREAVESMGADIVNDIAGGLLDGEMFNTVADMQVPYILMHMRGTPATMARLNGYDNVSADVIRELSKQVESLCLLGVNDIIIDPGFGFSKDTVQNFELMRDLEAFHIFRRPILVGISRKSMITNTLGITAEDAVNGSTVLNTLALAAGAAILRTHDVKQTLEAVKIAGRALHPEKI